MAAKKKVGMRVPTKNDLLKKYGNMIQLASDTREPGIWLPSTFLALNYTLGGGIPYGKILEIAGEESAGKSLLAYNFAYTCQQLGGQVIWVDVIRRICTNKCKKAGFRLRVRLLDIKEKLKGMIGRKKDGEEEMPEAAE